MTKFADRLDAMKSWTEKQGKEQWLGTLEDRENRIEGRDPEVIFSGMNRKDRRDMARQTRKSARRKFV